MNRRSSISITMRIWEWERVAQALCNCGQEYEGLLRRFGKKFDAPFYHEKAMAGIGNVPEGKR